MVGAPVSVVIYLVMMTQLVPEALITGVVWCVLGLVMFGVCTKVYGKPEELDPALVATSEPPAAERAKMDREFRVWSAATVVAVVVAIALYALPMLL